MTAGQLGARTMIKSHRADPPVGLSIAITDDVAHGDGFCETASVRRCTTTGALLDNFEWIFAYAKHFGLHTVDRETFGRTPKPSAAAYARIARAGAVPGD
ncbi:MAG TPA: family 1 glycosylhydrolase [Microlunatus sp.]